MTTSSRDPARSRAPMSARSMAALLVLCVVVALAALGFARGFWLANLHNGLLGLAFAVVGVVVLLQRPSHREGWLFLGVGLLEAVMFFGRQVGHASHGQGERWWAWLGIWPTALVIGGTTLAVVCFPEGRPLSVAWRRCCLVVVVLACVCAGLSALWPVEYDAAGVSATPPFTLTGDPTAETVWSALAHPFYAGCQLLWPLALAARWRRSDGVIRRQIALVLAAAAGSVVGLVVGLVGWGSARPGLLLAVLVPVAAGWAIERISLAKVIDREQQAGRLVSLTPRENDVLDLMAQGLSNAAIGERLHLSIKTVEPVVSSIFVKLGLPAGSDSNRRVLAVIEYLGR